MSDDLDALYAAAEAATPGPWAFIGGNEYLTGLEVLIGSPDGIRFENAAFVSAMRHAMPALIERVRDAEAQRVFYASNDPRDLMLSAARNIKRAEASESRVAELEAGIKALADGWDALDMGMGMYPEDSAHREAHEARSQQCAEELRALLNATDKDGEI